MKIVLQRVNSANVIVNNVIVGEIDKGILVFLGISKDFNEKKFDWMIDKILKLRLWASEDKGAVTQNIRSGPFLEEKPPKKGFDLSVKDISGEILVISQFTLFGDCTKGTKPNFVKACESEIAKEIYNKFILRLNEISGLKIESGTFGAKMTLNSQNDGPVTIILEK
jgi:D-tyrosyl-tRNA(Tyr) deacylase